MILLALAAAALTFEPAQSDRLPYAPMVSVSYVRVTADGTVSCATLINGVAQPGDDCSSAAGGFEGLRALRRDATLTMLVAFTPDGAAPPTGIEAGELIMEERARLEIAPDGSIVRCQSRVERVIREVAGVRPLDLCTHHTVGQREFVSTRGTDPRAAELSVLLFLREGPQR